MALTGKQKLFVNEYLVDLNATQAAMRAGYSEKTARSQGQRLLTKADVQALTSQCIDSQIERTEIDADYVLKTIRETVERCKETGNANGVLKGCELLGRHLKLFTEKIENTDKIVLMISEQDLNL
jgi:phage terminase small subunit